MNPDEEVVQETKQKSEQKIVTRKEKRKDNSPFKGNLAKWAERVRENQKNNNLSL